MSEESTHKSIQSRVRSLLKQAVTDSGISQKELARRLKVTDVVVSRWLNHDSNMELKSIDRLAQALGCELTIRFGKDSTP